MPSLRQNPIPDQSQLENFDNFERSRTAIVKCSAGMMIQLIN